MNEVVRVSIAGIGFVFDAGAYEELKTYLNKLEKFYSKNPDGKEIIEDIEARIVEIILSKQSAEKIVDQQLVHGIIKQLGFPEELESEGGPKTYASDTDSEKFPRRLYRDMEGAKLGGVCNGLGTFFGTDPVALRIGIFSPILLLIAFSIMKFRVFNGFLVAIFVAFIILYFLMWIAVPVARTPRQKLEMRGEKITASSIQRNISQESADMPKDVRKSASVFSKILIILGQIILFGIKFIVISIAFVFGIAAIFFFVALIMTLIDPSYIAENEIFFSKIKILSFKFDYISLGRYVSLITAAMMIPFIIIAYQLSRLVFKFRNNRTLMLVLAGGWLIIVAVIGVATIRNRDTINNILQDRYGSIEALKEYVDLDNVESMIINGDTILYKGKVKNSRKLYENIKSLKEIIIKTNNEGKISLDINLNKGSDTQVIQIRKILKDTTNGNNQ